jgi:hypothetical protein
MRLILVLLGFLSSPFAQAQEDVPAPVKLGDSEIIFARGEDEEIAVTYNGQEIYRNYYVAFDRLVKVEDVDVALISGGDGGNACGLATLIVTADSASPDAKVVIVGAECGGPDPAVTRHEILFVPYLKPGAKETVQVWTPTSGLETNGEIAFTPQPDTNWGNFDPKVVDHPYGIFRNGDIYAAAKTMVGDSFEDLIIRLDVSGNPETIESRYFVVSGCQAHACGNTSGFVGLDLEARRVYASFSDEGSAPQHWPADLTTWPEPIKKALEASHTP